MTESKDYLVRADDVTLKRYGDLQNCLFIMNANDARFDNGNYHPITQVTRIRKRQTVCGYNAQVYHGQNGEIYYDLGPYAILHVPLNQNLTQYKRWWKSLYPQTV